eukprot:9290075-Pyramimonas_sp.AAC.1
MRAEEPATATTTLHTRQRVGIGNQKRVRLRSFVALSLSFGRRARGSCVTFPCVASKSGWYLVRLLEQLGHVERRGLGEQHMQLVLGARRRQQLPEVGEVARRHEEHEGGTVAKQVVHQLQPLALRQHLAEEGLQEGPGGAGGPQGALVAERQVELRVVIGQQVLHHRQLAQRRRGEELEPPAAGVGQHRRQRLEGRLVVRAEELHERERQRRHEGGLSEDGGPVRE